MICKPCAQAADRRAPRTEHCGTEGGPGAACDCQHDTDKYRAADGFTVIVRAYEQLSKLAPKPIEPGPKKIIGIGEPFSFGALLKPTTETDQ